MRKHQSVFSLLLNLHHLRISPDLSIIPRKQNPKSKSQSPLLTQALHRSNTTIEITSHRDSAFVLTPPPNVIPCYAATTNLHHFHPRTSQIVVMPAAIPSNLHHIIVHHVSLL
ncbi:hypothetical protein V8G54_010192 [Vigna mungo]|uniref:Uncharacterized protein n=1 Tax=Vigna mungo TaxID=3915 RepID=A0AAQ3NWK9_VIGMU